LGAQVGPPLVGHQPRLPEWTTEGNGGAVQRSRGALRKMMNEAPRIP
jgi:hypothetical protein